MLHIKPEHANKIHMKEIPEGDFFFSNGEVYYRVKLASCFPSSFQESPNVAALSLNSGVVFLFDGRIFVNPLEQREALQFDFSERNPED